MTHPAGTIAGREDIHYQCCTVFVNANAAIMTDLCASKCPCQPVSLPLSPLCNRQQPLCDGLAVISSHLVACLLLVVVCALLHQLGFSLRGVPEVCITRTCVHVCVHPHYIVHTMCGTPMAVTRTCSHPPNHPLARLLQETLQLGHTLLQPSSTALSHLRCMLCLCQLLAD